MKGTREEGRNLKYEEGGRNHKKEWIWWHRRPKCGSTVTKAGGEKAWKTHEEVQILELLRNKSPLPSKDTSSVDTLISPHALKPLIFKLFCFLILFPQSKVAVDWSSLLIKKNLLFIFQHQRAALAFLLRKSAWSTRIIYLLIYKEI